MKAFYQGFDGNYVGKLEKGKVRCPREEHRRLALRRLPGALTEADLGSTPFRRSRIDPSSTREGPHGSSRLQQNISPADISQLAVPERKAILLLDTARALGQWGKYDRAFEALRQAERHATEEVRRRPAVHSLIHELERRTTGPLRKQLHDYALTVGGAA